MEIEGSYTLQATPHEVWNALADWQSWARGVFGIEQAEPLNAFSYRLTLHLHQAPLAGIYKQQVMVTEHHAPYYCHVTIAGDHGQLDAFDGYGIFHLNQHEQHTIIAYKGYIISGITNEQGAPVAPLVIKGAVMLLLQQFLAQLSERVVEQQHTSAHGAFTGASRHNESFIVHEEHIIIPAPSPSARQGLRWSEQHNGNSSSKPNDAGPAWLRWLVHLLRLGNGNPSEERRWTQRLRRYSIASVLLFLIWVGTRIPRK